MIRTSKHILKYSNGCKIDELEKVFKDYKEDLQLYINLIYEDKLPLEKRLSTKDLPINKLVHSTWRSIVYINASEVVRSLRELERKKRYRKYKKVYAYFKKKNRQLEFLDKRFSELNLKYKKVPDIKRISITLNTNIFDIQAGDFFDKFIKIRLPFFYFRGKKKITETIHIPIKWHRHSLRYKDWKRKDTIQLEEINGNFYATFFYEKEEIEKKTEGTDLGIDIGYKKLIVTSNNEVYGKNLFSIYQQISEKKQKSKNFKQMLVFRDNEINRSCNQLKLDSVKSLFIEDLKNVKHKNKFGSKINNKIQRWSYFKVISKLERMSEEQGVNLVKVLPAYTSQACSLCGFVDSKSRRGEVFECTNCKMILDADLNASRNILHRGVYRPSTAEDNLNNLKLRS